MTKTLKQIIASNDFTGYQVSDASWRLDSNEIEAAIYGNEGVCGLPYDLAERFAETYQVDLVAISTWMCTDTNVGLEVMRLQNVPVALLWQSARKADRVIAFLDKDALRSFQSKWEEAKQSPEVDCLLVPEDMLDMPLAAPDEEIFGLESYGRALPSLSAGGARAWIAAEGGLDAITDKLALIHARNSLQRNLKDRDAVLAEIRQTAATPAIAAAIEKDLASLNANRNSLEKFCEEVQSRILQLA